MPKRTSYTFQDYGGADQLRIASAADLAAVVALDEAFWMATSAPADQFTYDAALLKRLDPEGNGRIQSWEIRQAAQWLLDVLRDQSGIDARTDAVDLAALNTDHPDGARLHAAATRVLRNLADDDARVTLAEVRDQEAIFSQAANNGDGVIPPEAVEDDDLRAFVLDVMETVGTTPDLNGAAGVDETLLESFVSAADALLVWQGAHDDADGGLFPLGDATSTGYALYVDLREAVDRFFAQCDVVALNETLGRDVETVHCATSIWTSQAAAENYLRGAPLATPNRDGILPLQDGANPYYVTDLAAFTREVLPTLLSDGFDGRRLRAAQWATVKQAFEAYETWQAEKTGGAVEVLGPDTLTRYLDDGYPARLQALIDADIAAGEELNALHDLEGLLLLQQSFLEVCNNFVSFPALYDPKRRAMFEAGRLILGGRVYNLNLRIRDVEEHSTQATRSGLYLLYSEVTGAKDGERFYVVTPVTRGPVHGMGVGRRGVLFDHEDKEWDTRIVKILENPVSLMQAVFAPFKRLASLVASTAERLASGTETHVQEQVVSTSRSVAGMRDLFLSGSVAVAALGSAFAYIAAKLSELEANWWYFFAAIGVGVVLVVVPTAIIAYVKLWRQNLGALLEGSGWAMNAPMRLTLPQRRMIAHKPARPVNFETPETP